MSEVITDKLTGKTSAGDVTITSEGGSATMQLQQGVAKAWRTDETLYSNSNFVEDSFNISSATDANPGLYFDFTSSFANTGYAGVGTIAGFSADDVFTCKYGQSSTSREHIRLQDTGSSTSDVDASVTYIACGDLA